MLELLALFREGEGEVGVLLGKLDAFVVLLRELRLQLQDLGLVQGGFVVEQVLVGLQVAAEFLFGQFDLVV